MASLEGSNRAALEMWLGPIATGDGFGRESDLLDRLDRLEVPELVALEVLLADHAQMVRDATSVRSDDVASDHGTNVTKAMPVQIGRLAKAIRGSDTIVLSVAGEALVALAEVGQPDPAGTFDVVANNRRRG